MTTRLREALEKQRETSDHKNVLVTLDGGAPSEVVVGARFRVADGDPRAAEEDVAGIVRWRREHQPGGANAGSVFANPPGDSAGRLIDSLGLKGFRVGGACEHGGVGSVFSDATGGQPTRGLGVPTKLGAREPR